jgi:hypothetical protein
VKSPSRTPLGFRSYFRDFIPAILLTRSGRETNAPPIPLLSLAHRVGQEKGAMKVHAPEKVRADYSIGR